MTAEQIGWENQRQQRYATREPGRSIKPRRMGWVQRIIRFGVFCLMWVSAWYIPLIPAERIAGRFQETTIAR